MITLFSEEVETTSTNSNHNTLYVKSFSEAFFGVYEFEINGSPVIAERVGTFDNDPVISIPIVEADGSKKEMEFILKKGKQKVEIGCVASVITEKVGEVDPAPSSNVFYVDNFEEIHFDVYEFELNGQKLVAEKVGVEDGHPVVEVPIGNGTARVVLEKVKVKVPEVIEEKAINKADVVSKERQIRSELNNVKTDSKAAIKVIEEKLESAVDSVDRQKTELFIEFTRITDNLKRATKEDFVKFVEEINEQNKSNNSDLKEFVTEQLFNEYGNFLKRVKHTQEELKQRQKENKLIAANILALEKSQVDLNNTNDSIRKQITEATSASEKNVNKALSRLGVVKKELETSKDHFDTIKEDLATSIEKAEERVKLYYHEKIRMVEESVFKNIRREEILDTVKKSKAMILAELNNTNGLKDQLQQLATEAANGEYDPITGKRFQEQLKKDLNNKFAKEMQNIRRMMEMYSGGGTVAKQYANGGVMNGDLNVNGTILSGGVDISSLFGGGGGGGGTGEVGPGTPGTFSVFQTITSIEDGNLRQDGSEIIIENGSFTLSSSEGSTTLSASDYGLHINNGLDVHGSSTVYGNLSVLGDFTYIDSTVSVTSALSVINTGTGPALYAEQAGVGEPIAKFVDSEGGEMVIDDGGNVGIGVANPDEKLTVNGNISASGDLSASNVYGANITTLKNKQDALYSYLIQNFDTNTVTDATDISDFVTNYPKTGLTTGDVITVSASNQAYILGDNDGSALTDWLQVNLKPNFLFYKTSVPDYTILDVLPLSSAKSSKYIIEVEDTSDGALFYGEVNVVSDGTIAVATEYGLNHTTVFPFVEFGAEVVSGTHIQLSAIALEGKNMANFTFKGNRSNLFG